MESDPNSCAPVSSDDWADACGRMCTVDGFDITGKSILIAVRKPSDIPECGEYAKSVAQACNHLAIFSARHPRLIGPKELVELCISVNDSIVAGAVESKMLNEGREGRRVLKEMLVEHSARLSRVAADLIPSAGTGYLPMENAHRAGGFAYTFPLDMATVCPFGALNGMTGRMVAEAIRLRLRLPFFGFQMNRNQWNSELSKQQERGQHFSDISIIPVAELYGNVV